MISHGVTWLIALLVIFGIVVRPWKLPEAWWAVLGAVLLVVSSRISGRDALAAIAAGGDVYFFLSGMMLLAEVARREGLFDWLAAYAARRARGSPGRLFTLVYGVGTLVTIFLSNDATAVVLTPAVYAASRRAGANPLPYVYVCAFVANAASFVLPISNPANLVLFGNHMPTLGSWLQRLGAASVVSIAATYVVLRTVQRRALSGTLAPPPELPVFNAGARWVAAGIAATSVVLLVAAGLHWTLGLPTLIAGAGTALRVLLWNRTSPWPLLKAVSWSVLPLVAGLFVVVRAVQTTGLIDPLMPLLVKHASSAPQATAWALGTSVALLSNVVNNLPLGLVAASLMQAGQLPAHVVDALLIGVDLGPNLSVTGSLASILWLVALRREGLRIDAWRFLCLGLLVMPPALLGSLFAVVG